MRIVTITISKPVGAVITPASFYLFETKTQRLVVANLILHFLHITISDTANYNILRVLRFTWKVCKKLVVLSGNYNR